VALQAFELLPVVEADDVVLADRLLDRDGGRERLGLGLALLAAGRLQGAVHRVDQLGEIGRPDGIVQDIGADDVRGELD